jgi:hypothetical protein
VPFYFRFWTLLQIFSLVFSPLLFGVFLAIIWTLGVFSLSSFSVPARFLDIIGFGRDFVHEGEDIKIGNTRIGVLLLFLLEK